jgi:hypothetical protein
MARELSWGETVRLSTPTVEQVDCAHEAGDEVALMRLLILSNLAIAGHLDRIASAIERQGGA